MMTLNNTTAQYQKPVFRGYEVLDEEGVRHALINNVLLVLSDTVGSNFDPPEIFLHSSAHAAIRGMPHFILTGHARLTMAIEVKTRWALAVNDIVDVYLENIQDIAAQRTSQVLVVDPIKQIYGYLCHNGLQYGVLTTTKEHGFSCDHSTTWRTLQIKNYDEYRVVLCTSRLEQSIDLCSACSS